MRALDFVFVCAAWVWAGGCMPIAHLELADGTLVTFSQRDGDNPPREERAPDGMIHSVQCHPCDVSPQVGLEGEVTEREWCEPLPNNRERNLILRTLRITNVADKPLALRRFLAYGVASEPPEGVDAATGFTGVDLGDFDIAEIRPETSGFVCRVLPLARPWRIEEGVLIQPLASLWNDGETAYVCIPASLLAPGAEVIVRRLGGGPTLATLTPENPPSKPAPDNLLRYAYGPGLPPMLPLEVCFRAAPDAPATGWLLPSVSHEGAPAYALEGIKELNQDLAPGESLEFSVRFVSPGHPVKDKKKKASPSSAEPWGDPKEEAGQEAS